MRILVLLALYPVLSRCITVDCKTNLNEGDNLANLCVKPIYGGDKGIEDLKKTLAKAIIDNNTEEITRVDEFLCCAVYNAGVCASDWLQRCHNQKIEISKEPQVIGNYQCKKSQYPVGVCESAGIASSILLVFSAIGLIFFYSI